MPSPRLSPCAGSRRRAAGRRAAGLQHASFLLWGHICITMRGAWRGGLTLGFLGHRSAADGFPSKWARSRHGVPCQSNSLLWNREAKSPPSHFGGVREEVGTPLVRPCSLLTCLSLSPRPPDEWSGSGAAARARARAFLGLPQTKAKQKNKWSRAGNLSCFRQIISCLQHPGLGFWVRAASEEF